MSTPTKRSLDHLRKTCALVAVVERWNPHARIRQDLFGIIDILALDGAETIAVQSTSGSNVSARVKKLADSDAIAHVRAAGWKIIVHGWTKKRVKKGGKAMRWELREVDVS